jgi:hypothetical protein
MKFKIPSSCRECDKFHIGSCAKSIEFDIDNSDSIECDKINYQDKYKLISGQQVNLKSLIPYPCKNCNEFHYSNCKKINSIIYKKGYKTKSLILIKTTTNLKKTDKDAKKADKDAKKAIRDAKKAIRDAKKADKDAKKTIRDAKKAIRDAKKAIKDAKKADTDLDAISILTNMKQTRND